MKNKILDKKPLWKDFLLADYFDIRAGKYYYSYEYEEGTTPYITATVLNNGVSEYINLKPDFEGNCITTEKISSQAFYQKHDFCATSDVNIYTPKFREFNEYIGLFIVSVINFDQNYRWSYGRQCRVNDSKKIKVKLPAKEDGTPDWLFMDNYIRSLRYKKLTTKNLSPNVSFDVEGWGNFKLDELFDQIYRGETNVKANLNIVDNDDENSIALVTRTAENNGIDCYVDIRDVNKIEKGNALTIGDTTATIFYQSNRFVTGDHMVVCRAKWLNQYTGLFVKTILDQEKYRYSYGRAFKTEIIKETYIKLPVNGDGTPDWLLMEKIIKSYSYGDRL